jgi:hypothetical protein
MEGQWKALLRGAKSPSFKGGWAGPSIGGGKSVVSKKDVGSSRAECRRSFCLALME